MMGNAAMDDDSVPTEYSSTTVVKVINFYRDSFVEIPDMLDLPTFRNTIPPVTRIFNGRFVVSYCPERNVYVGHLPNES